MIYAAPPPHVVRDLLPRRVCDLELTIQGPIAECVSRVLGELRTRGVQFVPRFHLCARDFYTTDRKTDVGVPWFLATPDLWALANYAQRGYSRADVLRYLRHEVGHALGYAFRLDKDPAWVRLFGDMARPYPTGEDFQHDPRSRAHVRYLHVSGLTDYAQKHPDEDWAETFAVWLDPEARCWTTYRDWPRALAKLEYVARLPNRLPHNFLPPQPTPGLEPYTDVTETVGDFFGVDEASVMGPVLARRSWPTRPRSTSRS